MKPRIDTDIHGSAGVAPWRNGNTVVIRVSSVFICG
jgi:hypothetical protein